MERYAVVVRVILCGLIPFWLMAGASVGHGKLVDRIVAIVNGDVITLSELEEAVEPYAGQIRQSPYGPKEEEVVSRLRQEVLNRMIDETLTDQESKRLGILVDDTEVDQRISQIRGEQSMSEEELEKALEEEGYSLEKYRDRVKEQMLRMRLIDLEVRSKIAITEEEIESYYDKHKEDYEEQKRYHLRTILVRVPSSAGTDERDRALKKIEVVVEEFRAGTGFDELARRFSDDMTAKQGGDLGLFELHELSPEFRETVAGMKEGEISPIIRTPMGYQIIMLEQTEGQAGKSLEEAKMHIQDSLYNELVEAKYKEWLEELRKRSYIKIID